MNPYANVDLIIVARVKAANSTLYKKWAGAPARYFHIFGDPPFECFQVSVGLPDDGQIAIRACAIDTNDDTDDSMDQTWVGSVDDLDGMLKSAVETIDDWKCRPRTKPDPPSPW